MFGKVKKVFFIGVFGILYISFIAQLGYIAFAVKGLETQLPLMGALSLEWLVIIAARYLSKRSGSNAQYNSKYGSKYDRH